MKKAWWFWQLLCLRWLQMFHFECPRHGTRSWYNSVFDGQLKEWARSVLSFTKVKKLERGCRWSSLNAPGDKNPDSRQQMANFEICRQWNRCLIVSWVSHLFPGVALKCWWRRIKGSVNNKTRLSLGSGLMFWKLKVLINQNSNCQNRIIYIN